MVHKQEQIEEVKLGISEPISGNNHDLSNFKVHFEKLLSWLEMSAISVDGLFLNADAGFDSKECRRVWNQHKIHPNIAFNVRNGNINERFEYFDAVLYQNRTIIERAFAWIDAFKVLLVRY